MEATPEQLLDVHAEISKNAVRLVEGITADQWTEPTPCSEWDVRALVNHMAGTSKVLTASARREAPTSEPNDENLGDDPIASFTAAIAGAEAAWRAPEALAGEVNVPFDMPAVAALGVNILDIGTHCWDLATATGQDHGLSAGAVATIDAFNRQLVSAEVRAGGGFGDQLDPSSPDDLTEMLAFVGRRG